jgi:UDP-4-amino-4,6-dideoxy-N-acetyl-beta-L-altrosamine N-acetyltransferase
MKSLRFVDILSVDDELKDRVRQWRNKDRVRKCMLTQHHISREEHSKWLENLKTRDKQRFWVVFAEATPIGSVYLQNINCDLLSSEWGFYIGEDSYTGKGLGKRILYMLLERFFDEMGFNTLLTKVLSDNTAALRIYREFGFTEMGRAFVDGDKEILRLSFHRNDWFRQKEDIKALCAQKINIKE